jgi:hypothetical protein
MTSDYGSYSLSYTPSYGSISPSVKMEMSGEADLSEMLSLFDSFLKATGYVYDGELQIVDDFKSETVSDTPISWWDDGFSFTGNPYAPVSGTDVISFGATGTVGGLYDDKVILG